MEAVLALGKQPTRFVLFELGQAHGALQNGLGVGLRRVDKHRKRLEDSVVEAARGGRDGGGGSVLVEENMRAAVVAVSAEIAATRAEEVPARVKVETDHENYYEEEDDDGA